ncbi:hypothetical protein N9N28_12905 [Rubripirellula amarantea]|uniref:Uncharacterized protein n=1 Tax=Rubripirellula amarantea TaxID=2527999 RepID=A0A5C5WT46_9BACT|nr:hypothetical protein [Rubripirellula amarantea]MDA8745525.1 hypothetical protein [Rubripirellula amarantea]TWT53698.1 hypothetical protein Pla22_13290 [Rubripirellula amarantea]
MTEFNDNRVNQPSRDPGPVAANTANNDRCAQGENQGTHRPNQITAQSRASDDSIDENSGAFGCGVCVVCGGRTLIEIRGKLQCSRCHTICETCCEGGRG